MAARDPGGEKHAKGGTLLSRASRPQDLARPFFVSRTSTSVTDDGLSERGTTRSLSKERRTGFSAVFGAKNGARAKIRRRGWGKGGKEGNACSQAL